MDSFSSQVPPTERSSMPKHWSVIIGIIVLVVAIAVGGYFIWNHYQPHAGSVAVELVGNTSTAWYSVSGDTITLRDDQDTSDVLMTENGFSVRATLVPLPKTEEAPTPFTPTEAWAIMLVKGSSDATDATRADATGIKNLGLGWPLGILSDDSILALTPLGLSKVTQDGTAFEIVSAGGSETPIGAATKDLSLVAFENLGTRSIVLYHRDSSGSYSFVGDASLPRSTIPEQKQESSDEEIASSTQNVTLPPPIFPRMVGLTDTKIIVQGSNGVFYAFPIQANSVGEPVQLKVISTHE